VLVWINQPHVTCNHFLTFILKKACSVCSCENTAIVLHQLRHHSETVGHDILTVPSAQNNK